MDARELRGQEMAQQVKIVPKGDQWIVPSSSGNGKYLVKLDDEAIYCTCPDFEKRGRDCKHIHAVRFSLKTTVTTEVQALVTSTGEVQHATVTETVTETKTVSDGEKTVTQTETKTRKKTYKQNWPAYNLAQTNEKRDVQGLLHDLCRRIEEGPQKMGRPRLPLSDMAFATTFKIYSTVSGRRFISDLADAYERGYLSKLPHFNSVFNYLEDPRLTPVLKALITESSLPLRALETEFAVDSTAFSTSRFEKWFDVRWGHEVSRHIWMKAHLICGVKTNVVIAAEVTGKDCGDAPELPALVGEAAKHFIMEKITAGKAYCSIANLNAIAKHGAKPLIPFKTNMTADGKGAHDAVWQKAFHYFSFKREDFLAEYHKRSNMETTMSMIKAKFGDAVRSKSDTAIQNEVLCKVLCHNLCCLVQSFYEFKIDPSLIGAPIAGMALAA